MNPVVGFAAILGDVVEFPGCLIVARVAPHQLPVALSNGAGAEVIEVEGSPGQRFSSVKHGLHAGSCHRRDLLSIELFGVFNSGYRADCRHDVDQVDRGPHPAIRFPDALRPVGDQLVAIASFVVEVLVHSKRRVAQAGPGAADGMVRSRAAYVLQLFALVQGGLAAAAAPVEAEGPPFIAGAVVAGKED